ncbi:peptide/nickel transport system permease protein [Pseudoxanthobacter soli DSM 19599]|uniref:Peptide/nickel transport system permease protein n=1 Tax=Pseudoxanthobacter soli DSM 19599 TaxID=1123029 RepID=A0A1M7ZPV4_9HYPH|nr:ABC transporter permease [Pseudoxanthobacter soli]SHO66960.1 peptide/nickel transport system permease protein [Pseudoxanthobacter soli DSM 19599]
MSVDAAPPMPRTAGVLRRLLRGVRRFTASVVRQPSGAIGLALVLLHIAVALGSPWIVPYDPTAQDPNAMFAGPSPEHWLGTDALGRDVLTRTLLGGREALAVTAIAAAVALAWGGALGIAAGTLGGLADRIVIQIIDAFLALPWLVFVAAIASVVGTGTWLLVPALAFFYGLPIVRVARNAALEVEARDFVTAARARGESTFAILRLEVMPNVQDVLLVEGAMEWSWMLIAFSSLSFLGFGVAPPNPDWGLMISDARLYLTVIPFAALGPMVALASLVIGINLLVGAVSRSAGIEIHQGVEGR